MTQKLVSIIMPSYNAEKFIEAAMNSVINQTYNNWELIICDDCSTDNTVRIIKKYKERESRISLIELEKNSGAAVARNSAIEVAKGDYISFLDSDDLWFKDKLEKQILFMERESYTFSCTYYNKINEKGETLNSTIKYGDKVVFKDLLKNCPGNSTVIYSASELGKIYVPDIRKRNDYLMWFQVINKSKELNCYDEVLSSHRLQKNSLSKKKTTLLKYHWVIYRKKLGLSVLKSMYLCFFWVCKSFKRKLVILTKREF